jgi:hypothetical protein
MGANIHTNTQSDIANGGIVNNPLVPMGPPPSRPVSRPVSRAARPETPAAAATGALAVPVGEGHGWSNAEAHHVPASRATTPWIALGHGASDETSRCHIHSCIPHRPNRMMDEAIRLDARP